METLLWIGMTIGVVYTICAVVDDNAKQIAESMFGFVGSFCCFCLAYGIYQQEVDGLQYTHQETLGVHYVSIILLLICAALIKKSIQLAFGKNAFQ